MTSDIAACGAQPWRYLKTGVPNLDRLLDMDAAQAPNAPPEAGGILLSEPSARPGGVPPITLISGEAGTGKTTMVLQIAWNLAVNEGHNVYLYSLEQSVAELDLACSHFGFLKDGRSPLQDLASVCPPVSQGLINLCHLTPLPLGPTEEISIFEERLLQLSHVLATTQRESVLTNAVFFLDSLNAFGTGDLRRHDVHRLFALFRSYEVPAIVTCERGAPDSGRGESLSSDARFLADIVIDLRKGTRKDYLLFDLEISKNRRSSQALGHHLYKTRTKANAERQNLSESGIFVYPSIHAVLSMARKRSKQGDSVESAERLYRLTDPSTASEMRDLLLKDDIEAGACIAVIGPRGTHKRALAINLATGSSGRLNGPSAAFAPESRHLLVLSFGVYGGIEFSSTAWFDERTEWSSVSKRRDEKSSKVKSWRRTFTLRGAAQATNPMATILNFQVGNLAPEEAFHLVEESIQKAVDNGQKFSAVLLCDTSEICTGFPLLRSDPLFLPTLIDLVHSHDLVFVGVGVDGPDTYTGEMNAGLLAVADYRVTLSHYPSTYDLSKSIVEDCLRPPPAESAESRISHLSEQVACIVVDNVSGHQYGRVPLWLWVSESTGAKVLHSGNLRAYLSRRNLDATDRDTRPDLLPTPLVLP